ncbi:hypothetical protein OIV83_004794 [Microbotryomycetes sp. JL201]|nr:hypothetical protein OIV83_004794 [Microbotryomycetes sp. JL201]
MPMPPGQVLYPSLVLSVQVNAKHSVALLQSVLREADQQAGNRPLIIGCAPYKSTATASPNSRSSLNSSHSPDSDDDNNNKDTLKVIKLPTDTSPARNALKPKPEDLFEYATAARIVRLERHSSGGFIIVLEGLTRLRLPAEKWQPQTLPFLENDVQIVKSTPLEYGSPAIQTLQDVTTQLLTTLAATAPISALLNRRLRALIANLSHETAPALVDAVVASIPATASTGLTFEDKLAVLAAADGTERVQLGIEIITRCDEALNLKKRIGDKVDQNLSRRQREYVLMQQLQAIRQELEELAKADGAANGKAGTRSASGTGRRKALPSGDEDEDDEGGVDDMQELEKAIKAKDWTEESKKVAWREFKRLKKSPPQGAEHGVIRNYLDWLLAIPWNESTPLPLSRDFIDAARQKLNDDHYGLEKVKKRLLEWLAVLRLKQEQWDAEKSDLPSTTETPVPSTELVLHESSGGPPAAVSSGDESSAPPSKSPTPARQKPRDKGPILLLCGPPGTGKTSIARSLADSMGRKFYRISLGGVRDEAEIRGHRRTYVSALPGALAQALKTTGVNNPVILLDEIDKLGMSSTHGDPGAALLEVLDPEQNWCFKDHYLDVPLDLSSVLFIATANSLETISDPLYDRMEAIQLSGYTPDEKLHIAKKYLMPKQIKANSLPDSSLVSVPDDVLLHVVTHYTHEAGVRSLEREIGAVCRAKAVEYAEARDKARQDDTSAMAIDVDKVGYKRVVTKEDVERYLGVPKYDREELERENLVGVSTGLSYQGSGNGGILHIETTTMPGKGTFHLTGQLGDVIQESARLAFTWVKSHAFELGIASTKTQDVFKDVDVHLHLPSGSIKKDGPSAGVAMVVAIVSLMRGIRQRKAVAMTGEITLRGNVTPVGGIKEKILGAHRAGIQTVILPLKNRKDVESDLSDQIKTQIKVVYVRSIWEALEEAFGPQVLWSGGANRDGIVIESRL